MPSQIKENNWALPALVFPAPRSFGSLDWCFQVELYAEKSLGPHSAKVISEVLARYEIDPPDVGRRRRDCVNGFLIRGKHLPRRHANARRQSAIHSHCVRRAIFVAMIVSKQDAVFSAGQHPRSRAVFANNERNANAILFARTNVHYESLVFKRRVIGWSRDHGPGESFAAELLQFLPKNGVGGLGLRLDRYC